MAFPHPQSRKDHYRKEDKPSCGGVVWKPFKRTIGQIVARYLKFAELMQEFRVDCAAPYMLALDAFFWRFYFGKLKG